MRSHHEFVATSPLRHTQYGFYLTAIFSTLSTAWDSAQSLVARYHFSKRWFWLYGVMVSFAYLYTRPLIRRRLGSASAGTINWSTVYVVWLCAAVFYHLPSLDSLGLDVRADVSMIITVFLGSLAVLAALGAGYGAGVAARVLSPRLLDRTAGARDVFTTAVLNSMTFAVACSSYYSLCGNAAAGGGDGGDDMLRAAVCGRWLRPLSAVKHPLFSGWVIYGESAANDTASPVTSAAAADPAAATAAALRAGSIAAPQPISPVFTAWLTLFAMLLVNSVADYAAGAALSAAYSAAARRDLVSEAQRRAAAARRLSRRRSAEFPPADRPRPGSADAYASLGLLPRSASRAGSLDVILRTVSSVGALWPPTGLDPGSGLRAASNLLFRDDFGIGTASPAAIDGVDEAMPVPGSLFSDPAAAAGVGLAVDEDAPAPSFLPMFPWYSGTSADLIKTLFDLMVSVKLFLGRYDARTMQAASAGGGGPVGGSGGGVGGAPPPSDGDGFTFEHLGNQEEAWIDFTADTGDGGDSTYAIARCLAAPRLTVEMPSGLAEAAGAPPELAKAHTRVLPRASALVHGGDLAYPSPTDETYEQRLFQPYEDALPPPAHVHPGRIVVSKPALPGECWEAAAAAGPCEHSGPDADQPCAACFKAAALAAYTGPSAFLIPGNHDWVDGLETFTRHVAHRGWLGGWALPQERSYFALRLPGGWWLLAMDLALVDDLDMAQYRYFARIAEERMGPNDAAILVNHAPHWLINWFWGRHEGKNLRQLLRGPLKGRARVHLCGDLHFYMRHSFRPYARGGGGGPSAPVAAAGAGISPPGSEMSTPAGASPLGGASPVASACPTPAIGGSKAGPTPPGQLHQSLLDKLRAVRTSSGTGAALLSPPLGSSSSFGSASCLDTRLSGWSDDEASVSPSDPLLKSNGSHKTTGGPSQGTSPPQSHPSAPSTAPTPGMPIPGRSGARELPPLPHGSPLAGRSGPTTVAAALAGTSPSSWWPLTKAAKTPDGGSPRPASLLGASPVDAKASKRRMGVSSSSPSALAASAAGMSADGEWEPPPPGFLLNDPEHLIVCGGGGAFLHPTHVFSYARFRPPHDPAAGAIYLRPAAAAETAVRGRERDRPASAPGQSSEGTLRRSFPSDGSLRGAAAAPTPAPLRRPAGGEYRCEAAFPTPQQSLRLGRANLHAFRHVNSRFDVIGGALYYLLVISVLPRCTGVASVLDAHSLGEGAAIFAAAAWGAVVEIFAASKISLAALAVLFFICFGFAGSGGVGAISGVPPAARRRPEYRGFALAVRARLGGVAAQAAYAAAHTAAHLTAAITLVLLLELGVETMIRYEGVGAEGYHSLYRWYRSFEAQHFPDPAGVRSTLSTFSLGLYPNVIKWAFALFDVPEAITVARSAACAAGGALAGLSRLQALGYYAGVLAYFWVLATPTVGFVFGLYLYVSGNWLHVHYDEAFSALQVPHHKAILRLHVTRDGDLEVFALGLEETPSVWREDPRWRGSGGGGAPGVVGHRARFPSRWAPVAERGGGAAGRRRVRTATPPEAQLKVVDYLYVPKRAATP